MIVKPFKPLLFLMRFLRLGVKDMKFYLSIYLLTKIKRFPSSYDLKNPNLFSQSIPCLVSLSCLCTI